MTAARALRPGPTPHARGVTMLAAASVAFTVILASCGGDTSGGDAQRFCGEIETNKAALVSPDLVFANDVQPLIDLYKSIGKFAPLSIEQEWDQLVLSYEAAGNVIPGDPESEQIAVATALQSEKSAAAVDRWLSENCGVDLGPLATLVPQS